MSSAFRGAKRLPRFCASGWRRVSWRNKGLGLCEEKSLGVPSPAVTCSCVLSAMRSTLTFNADRTDAQQHAFQQKWRIPLRSNRCRPKADLHQGCGIVIAGGIQIQPPILKESIPGQKVEPRLSRARRLGQTQRACCPESGSHAVLLQSRVALTRRRGYPLSCCVELP